MEMGGIESLKGARGARGVGLRLERSRVQLAAVPRSGNDLGQVVLATRKVTVGLASNWPKWPCVTDFSGLSTCGLKD